MLAAKVDSVLSEEGDASSWFLTHRHFLSNRFLIKIFVLLAVIQYAILFVLFGLQVAFQKLPNLLSYVFIGLTILYVIAFLILIIKIRRVRDAFYIKKEYAGGKIFFLTYEKALGIWLIAMIILYIALTQSGSPTARVVSGDLYGMLTYFGMSHVSTDCRRRGIHMCNLSSCDELQKSAC